MFAHENLFPYRPVAPVRKLLHLFHKTAAYCHLIRRYRLSPFYNRYFEKFEETLRTTISNALEIYKENGVPKGEFVLVVSAPEKTEAVNEETLTALLKQALESASLKDAVARIVAETGLNKKTVYEKALEIKNGGI